MPTGKLEPEATDGVRLATEQLSDAVGALQVTTLAQVPGVFGTLIGAGTPVITGSSPSVTVTVKLAGVVFPEASVAV
jgi:hypothetical protein